MVIGSKADLRAIFEVKLEVRFSSSSMMKILEKKLCAANGPQNSKKKVPEKKLCAAKGPQNSKKPSKIN